MQQQLEDLRKTQGFLKHAPNKFIIVGDLNKTSGDNAKERKVSFDEAEIAFGEYRIAYLEVNTKTLSNME